MQGNWLTRNFRILKGVVAAGVLAGLAFASLSVFEHELGNVLWAISMTLAVLVAALRALFGGPQAAESA
ncbi:hypothetical protein [Halorussus caseinilyticus]|uniref:Uncharacterized protein n=1 Tax=Halorussus caseinilyticus TaxID=3034025 RepID=A0ABD5WQF0_9EURY|nr:hypothetical protein [Halorussus sp. DT72]